MFDTTNYTDTSKYLKSQLKKNFVSDNHWLETYQDKINYAWDFASNVVDIEESIEIKNNDMIQADVSYQSIEARISSVYNEKGLKLSDDFKQVVFKDITHPLRLSQKYRFNIKDFQQTDIKTKSVWLNINYDETNKGASAILRRCNSTLGFLIKNNTLEWYEPAIVENEFSYTNLDFNTAIKIPQDEIYVTVQYNEYTKKIAVSDRFIIGALDFDNLSNNIAYKVKAVHRLGTNSTYQTNDIAFVKLVLNRDSINLEDDYICQDNNGTIHYIANYYTMYKQDGTIVNDDKQYSLQISPQTSIIYEGETVVFECNLYNQGVKIEDTLQYTFELPNTVNDNLYYKIDKIDNNHFAITNLHKYYKSDLIITVSPSDMYIDNIQPLTFNVQLGEAL